MVILTFMRRVRLGKMPRRNNCALLDLEREAMRSTSSAVRLTSLSSCSGEADSQSLATGARGAS